MKLRLTQQQRLKLFRREPVSINGQGIPPVEPGETVKLSDRVVLHVHRVHRKGERWSLHYTLKDTRDPVRMLKRTPRAQNFEELRRSFDGYGYAQEPTESRIADAAEESAYTSAPTSLGDAGEAVDRATQQHYTKQAQTVDELRERRRQERWEMQTLADRVAALEAFSDDADLTRILAAIERRVVAAEKKLRAA